ncbi:MAG TPA: ATP synthase subunit I [Gammaproteobacteria bacterium]|nr:ATP synthase subunit I [Gammaproteobacteria bacterium]
MHSEFTTNKAAACRLLAVESVLTLLIVLMLFTFGTVISAYSALLGGLAYVIPNAWFVLGAFNDRGRMTPQTILNRFYLGEAGKLFLTAIIFALCFLIVEPLHIGALFLTYCVMLLINLAGLSRIAVSSDKQ